MLHFHTALVSESKHLPLANLLPVAAALSKQIVRDFSPMWRRTATVNAFASRAQVPVGTWPLIVQDNIGDPSALGYHTDDNGQPYSLIKFDPDWSITASHEMLEMLADPYGNRLYPGTINGKKVMILQELCDPIDGVPMSDFLTPEWYDGGGANPSKHYSFLHKLTAPHQVAADGYVSWLDPTNNHWYQETNFGSLVISDLGVNGDLVGKSLREKVDHHGRINHPLLGKK